jgi:tricorn protease
VNRAKRLVATSVMAMAVIGAAQAQTPDNGPRLMRYPDIAGTQIAFVYADKLWVADDNGANARTIDFAGSQLTRLRFSPDGRSIAFSASVEGNIDVYVVPVDGSAAARRMTHHPAADLVVDWHPEGHALLFASTMSSPRATYNQLHLVGIAGGLPERVSLPYGETATYTADGKSLLFTYMRDFQEEAWKRYYGGRAPDIWRYDVVTGATQQLTDHAASDSMPMIADGETYYLSERDASGRSNIWRLGKAASGDKAITSYTEKDVRRPATDGRRIIFEVGGELAILDPSSGATRTVTPAINTAEFRPAPREKKVGERLTSAALAPNGVTVEARGDIFLYRAARKPADNLSASSEFAERFPRANRQGDIAYVSDADGEYALYVRSAKGGAARKLADFGPGFRYHPFWSPDGSRIAIFDQEQVLWVVDVATGDKRRVDQGKWGYHPDMVDATVSWSPDGRWLAYARGLDNRNNAIFLYDSRDGKSRQLTSGAFNDFAPVFDRGGNYLLALSHRRFDPTFGDLAFDATWTYTNGTVVSLIPLRTGLPVPVAANWTKPVAADEIIVDFDGAERRLRVLAAKPGLLTNLRATRDGYVVLRQGDGDAPNRLEAYALDQEEPTLLQSEKKLALLDAAEDRLLSRADQQLFVIGAKKGKPEKIDMTRFTAIVDPAAEAQQMFNDAWRYGRDFYYDPGTHGIDWSRERARFAPLVRHVTNDDDLTFIVREMVAELNGGHVYASATAPRSRGDARNVGLLGVDYAVDDGKYRIKRIYRSGSRTFDIRSPLDESALDVREGDYLLAVNGKSLTTATDPWAAFAGLADKEVDLTIGRAGSTERTVRVKTLASERKLRELAWVEENRRKVEAASNGRIGYIYVPNTGAEGQNELMIQYRSQIDKDALIIDERFNTGGALGDRMVELLNRPPLVYFRARNSNDYPLPELAHGGPKAMLINGWSYSGGDGFPLLFKTAKIGPLIGRRTWGGLIGPGLSLPLINGGFISPAPQRVYTTDGSWAEGNEGVRPDIEIGNDPGLLARGIDQQLDTAIKLLGERIASAKPVIVPPFQGSGDWKPVSREEK